MLLEKVILYNKVFEWLFFGLEWNRMAFFDEGVGSFKNRVGNVIIESCIKIFCFLI